MNKVVLKRYTGDWDCRVEVWLNGECVGGGEYGGPPEDNHRDRDYWWVEDLLSDLALGLGAEVEAEDYYE